MILVPTGAPAGAARSAARAVRQQPRLVTEARQRAARSPSKPGCCWSWATAARAGHRADGDHGRVAGDPVALASFAAVGTWLGQAWPTWPPS